MSFYEYIVSKKDESLPVGQLARDMLWLAERFPYIKKLDSFYDLVSLGSNSLIHRHQMLGGDLSREGFLAVSDALWEEYCDAVGKDPVKDDISREIPVYPRVAGTSCIPYWVRLREMYY